MLASEYGWAALEGIYFEDVTYYTSAINRRKRGHYSALTTIYHNSKPQELIESLQGTGYDSPEVDEFDKTGFELLKARMRQNPRMVVKG
jgi:hypothetical protein